MEEASNGERKREKQKEEGGIVFSDMQSYFSIALFLKLGVGFFMSVIYRNKKEHKELEEKINHK